MHSTSNWFRYIHYFGAVALALCACSGFVDENDSDSSTNDSDSESDTDDPEIIAPLPQTGQAQSYETGDDGDHQSGIPWPKPRFIDNGDGTVVDNLTQLIWLATANCAGATANWETALSFANTLYDGCTNCFGTDGDCNLDDGSGPGDWRLPNFRELYSLVNHGTISPPLPLDHPFLDVGPGLYWSSTTSAGDSDSAWTVSMTFGSPGYSGKWGHEGDKTNTNLIWVVRGSTNSGSAPVPRTGQTISYAAGDDGDELQGIPLPSPRFIENSDGTVTDRLTQLVWLGDTNCAADDVDWATGLAYAKGLYDGCGDCFGTTGDCGLEDGSDPGDWRLPNLRELLSLVDSGRVNPALPEDHPFDGVQSALYWTSTTYVGAPTYAWVLHFQFGSLGYSSLWAHDGIKSTAHGVFAVRDLK